MRQTFTPQPGSILLDGHLVCSMTITQDGDRLYVSRVDASTVLVDRAELADRVEVAMFEDADRE